MGVGSITEILRLLASIKRYVQCREWLRSVRMDCGLTFTLFRDTMKMEKTIAASLSWSCIPTPPAANNYQHPQRLQPQWVKDLRCLGSSLISIFVSRVLSAMVAILTNLSSLQLSSARLHPPRRLHGSGAAASSRIRLRYQRTTPPLNDLCRVVRLNSCILFFFFFFFMLQSCFLLPTYLTSTCLVFFLLLVTYFSGICTLNGSEGY